MAKRTLWGLLPWFQLFDDNLNPLKSDFEIAAKPGLALRRTPQQLLTPPSDFIPQKDISNVKYSTWSVACDFGNIVDQEPPKDLINLFSTLVRISYSRWFFPQYIFETDANGALLTQQYWTQKIRDKPPHWERNLYLNELNNLRDLFPLFKDRYDSAKTYGGRVLDSISFFNASLWQGDRVEEWLAELLLLVTSLECLFNINTKSIKHDLAHRTAALLQSDQKSFRSAYDEIVQTYKVRCKIVHGSINHLKMDSVKSSCDIIRAYLRGILSKLITNEELETVWHKKSDYKRWITQLDKIQY